MAEVYPQLDPSTCRHLGGAGVLAAWMHTPERAAAPRRYVARENGQVTLYDGTILDRTAAFPAHDARQLGAHWERLPDVLQGQFTVARVTEDPATLELMTDSLGMHQVYYHRQGETWLISNSVAVLVRITKVSEFDPLGVSMLLNQTWVWDDRTLRRGTRTIPGGQRWKWPAGAREPVKEVYFSPASLRNRRQRRMGPAGAQRLAGDLTKSCRILADHFGRLHCPITGGRDSRVLASLLIRGQIPARFSTEGAPSSVDIEIASDIARTFALPYEVEHKTVKDIVEKWDSASRRLVRQGDGMINLWQISDVIQQPAGIDRLDVVLSGLGGEIARGNYYKPNDIVQRRGPEDVIRLMTDKLVLNCDGLVRPEVKQASRAHLRQYMQRVFDEGFSPFDALDVFYTYQRVGRWGGSLLRRAAPISDPFLPLCTRPFVEAAFSMPARYRCCHSLHYQLIRLLAPRLMKFPFDKGSWRSQWPLINLLQWLLERFGKKAGQLLGGSGGDRALRPPGFDHAAWLEAEHSWIREICLGQGSSVLWDFINRPMFERILSDPGAPELRRKYRLGIYSIATLFCYAAN